jgi:hypothetical protein
MNGIDMKLARANGIFSKFPAVSRRFFYRLFYEWDLTTGIFPVMLV